MLGPETLYFEVDAAAANHLSHYNVTDYHKDAGRNTDTPTENTRPHLPVVDEYTARAAVAVLVSGHAGDHRYALSQFSCAPLSLPQRTKRISRVMIDHFGA